LFSGWRELRPSSPCAVILPGLVVLGAVAKHVFASLHLTRMVPRAMLVAPGGIARPATEISEAPGMRKR